MKKSEISSGVRYEYRFGTSFEDAGDCVCNHILRDDLVVFVLMVKIQPHTWLGPPFFNLLYKAVPKTNVNFTVVFVNLTTLLSPIGGKPRRQFGQRWKRID